MLSLVLLLVSSVALSTAQQNNDNQFVTQDFTYFVVPREIIAQNENADASNQENQQESYSRYINLSPVEVTEQMRTQESKPVSNESDESIYRKIQEIVSSYSEQKSRQEQFDNGQEKQFLGAIPRSNKNQGERKYSEELQKQRSRISGNSQVYSKSISAASEDQPDSNNNEEQRSRQAQPELNINEEQRSIQAKPDSNNNEEQRSSQFVSGVEYVLRNHGVDGFGKQNAYRSEESNYENIPFVNQQQGKRVLDNQALLKALSAIAEDDQFLNVAQSEQSSQSKLKEKEQEDAIISKAIEDILRSRDNKGFGIQNGFGLKQSNYQNSPVIVLKNNLVKEKAQSAQPNNSEEEQRNVGIRKLIEEVLKERNNDNGEQNGSRSEENSPSINKEQQQQISNNNRIYLRALSTISQEQQNKLSREYSGFGKRS